MQETMDFDLEFLRSETDYNLSIYIYIYMYTGTLQIWAETGDIISDCKSNRQISGEAFCCQKEIATCWFGCYAISMQIWGSFCSCCRWFGFHFRQSLFKTRSSWDGK